MQTLQCCIGNWLCKANIVMLNAKLAFCKTNIVMLYRKLALQNKYCNVECENGVKSKYCNVACEIGGAVVTLQCCLGNLLCKANIAMLCWNWRCNANNTVLFGRPCHYAYHRAGGLKCGLPSIILGPAKQLLFLTKPVWDEQESIL